MATRFDSEQARGPLTSAELARLAELLDRHLACRATGYDDTIAHLSVADLRLEIATTAGLAR